MKERSNRFKLGVTSFALSAGVATGFYAYEAFQYSAEQASAVDACARQLGPMATKASELPTDCEDFMNTFAYKVTSSKLHTGIYTLPTSADFIEKQGPGSPNWQWNQNVAWGVTLAAGAAAIGSGIYSRKLGYDEDRAMLKKDIKIVERMDDDAFNQNYFTLIEQQSQE